ncbi:hypothetical protein GCM10023192_14590 [Amycolatopsis samaneae]
MIGPPAAMNRIATSARGSTAHQQYGSIRPNLGRLLPDTNLTSVTRAVSGRRTPDRVKSAASRMVPSLR